MPKRGALQRMRLVANQGARSAVRFARKNPKKAIEYAVKGVQLLKTLVNVEKKFINTSIVVPVSTSGGIQNISLVGQGDTDVTRNGDSIKMHGLQCHLTAVMSTSAEQSFYRYMIVLDKDTRQGTAAMTDVLESSAINSFTNRDGHDRFVVLKDDVIPYSITGNQTAHREFFIPLDLHAKYVSSGATAADSAQNQILFVHVSNEAVNSVYVNFQSRISFYDN